MKPTELDALIKKAENGTLRVEDLTYQGTEIIMGAYGAAVYSYKKFKKGDMSKGDTEKVLRHAMYEMVHQEHEVNSVLIPHLLDLYQRLHTK